MSKIGDYNLQLQEQANELGFKTVQEALDAGYMVCTLQEQRVPIVCEPTLVKGSGLQEEAHKEWLKEKEEVLKELNEEMDAAHEGDRVDWRVLSRAIDFIARGEI